MPRAKITPDEAARLRSSAAVKAAVKAFRRTCEAHDEPCWICGGQINYSAPANFPTAFEADHSLPLAQFPEYAADPAVLRASCHQCNRSRGSSLGKGPRDRDQLGTPSQDWDELSDLPVVRRPGAARRRASWYEQHGIGEDDHEAAARVTAQRYADDDEQAWAAATGRSASGRPAARSGYAQDDDELGEAPFMVI